MYFKEEDAKKKCCPVLTKIDNNGPVLSDKIVKCTASDCMMWRFKRNLREPYTQGYCGLASKPEE